MNKEILDFEEFMNRVQDDKELFLELLDIFVNDFHKKRNELDTAIAGKDAMAVEHIAHFLKGSCGNISAKSLRSVFVILEEKAKRGDLEGLQAYLPDIDRKFEELAVCIGEVRKEFS
jgi:HPt (histidine-containing phosphotransfer) domain-containing protein